MKRRSFLKTFLAAAGALAVGLSLKAKPAPAVLEKQFTEVDAEEMLARTGVCHDQIIHAYRRIKLGTRQVLSRCYVFVHFECGIMDQIEFTGSHAIVEYNIFNHASDKSPNWSDQVARLEEMRMNGGPL